MSGAGKNLRTAGALLTLALAIASAGVQFYLIFDPLIIRPMYKIIHMALIYILLCAISAGLCVTLFEKREERARCVRVYLLLLFIYYILLMVGLLYFNSFVFRTAVAYKPFERLLTKTNLIPFKTVYEFASGFSDGTFRADVTAINLIGNVTAFMPLGVFVLLLFPGTRRAGAFALTMLCILVAIELIQGISGYGSCDIDDVILNLGGAFVVFALSKLRAARTLMGKLYLE